MKLGVQSSSLSSLPSVALSVPLPRALAALRPQPLIRAIRGLKLARFPPRSALRCALLPSMSLHPVAPFSSQTGLTIQRFNSGEAIVLRLPPFHHHNR